MTYDVSMAECWSRVPHYRPGKKLAADELNASYGDLLQRDRLMGMAMHGVGVSYGFDIKEENGCLVVIDGCIEIGCGLGFDRYGRMLVWHGGLISLNDMVGNPPKEPGRYVLTVHYAERAKDFSDPCLPQSGWINRCVAFTFEKCVTPSELCPEKLTSPCDQPELVSSDCGRLSYATSGLKLACIGICAIGSDNQLGFDGRSEVEVISVPARIASYSWCEKWMGTTDGTMPFSTFERRAIACIETQKLGVDEGFVVRFTRPVRRSTLHSLSVLMEINILKSYSDGWDRTRIPIEIKHLNKANDLIEGADSSELAWGLLICPDRRWVNIGIAGIQTELVECDPTNLPFVEITLRGQIIRDACGFMLDARPPEFLNEDLWRHCDGQTRPGGNWISAFRIGPD